VSEQKVYDYLSELNVSRETFPLLAQYVQLLLKWNQAYNLVGKTTESQMWDRHVLDSVQVLPHVDLQQPLLDIGTGAGLPGLLLAVLGAKEVHLVDSNHKKGQFLRMAARQLGIAPYIYTERLEKITSFPVKTITCRAFKSLDTILDMTQSFQQAETIYVLLKGATWTEEVATAHENWQFESQNHPSMTADGACILCLESVKYSGNSKV